jgi:hypothetical protein
MHSTLRLCALVALSTASHAAQVAATPRRVPVSVALQRIALTGEHAPGAGSAALFTAFGVVPGIGTPTLGAAALDARGVVVFSGFAADPAQGPTVAGLWRRIGATLAPVALTGDQAPGTTGVFSAFPSVYFSPTPHLVDGRVLFLASLGSTAGVPTGLWSDRSGTLELVVLAGQSLPGLPSGSQIDAPTGVLAADGVVVLHANYSGGTGTQAEREAFWRDDGQATTLVVRNGEQAPGFAPGVVFGPAHQFARGAFDDWDASVDGQLAFSGFVKGAGIVLDNDEGIWVAGPAGLQLVAREGAPAPGAGAGAVFLEGPGLHTFTVAGTAYHAGVRINAAGTAVFGAGLTGQGFDHGDSLWLHRGGALVLIAKAFSGASSFNADHAPGFPAGVTFVGFGSDVLLNAHDDVAFAGGVSTGQTGLWVTRGGALQLVARSGGPVPDVPGATFQNLGLWLGELGDSGSLLFTAAFAGPGVTYWTGGGLFLVDSLGQARLLVRRGQLVDVVGDGSDLRTVSDIGTQGPFEAGVVSLKLLFTDGSSGLFTVRWTP